MIARLHRRRGGLPVAHRSRRAVAAGIVACVLVGIAVGEVAADVVSSATPASLLEERSYVAAVVPVVDESTALEPWLRIVRDRPRSLGREGLFGALARLESGSGAVLQQLDELGIPAPNARSGSLLWRAMSDRVSASRALATGVTAAVSGSSSATAALDRAAREIVSSDRVYRAFVRAIPRRAKRRTAVLPQSTWASTANWSPASLSSYAVFLSRAPSLAVREGLSILAFTVEPPVLRITPTTTTTTTTSTSTTTTSTTTLPRASTSSSSTTSSTTTTSTTTTTTTLQVPPADSTSWLAPTSKLTVVVVVGNTGDAPAGTVTVTASLRLLSHRAPSKNKHARPPLGFQSVKKVLSGLAPGASRDLSLPRLSVVPGTLYRLTVKVSGSRVRRSAGESESVKLKVSS